MSASNDASSEPDAKKIKLKRFRVGRKKKERLFCCVTNNDVDFLKQLLYSPKLYRVFDREGNSLLQVAMLRNKKEVFDYILSLDNFPLENRNTLDQTALMIALTGFYYNDSKGQQVEEYFAIELIKKGAQIHKLALHDAVHRNFVNVAKLLLDKGFDPNTFCPDKGTALHVSLSKYRFGFYCELEALLLSYGADLTIENEKGFTVFELFMRQPENFKLYEHFFFYTFDEFTLIRIHLSTFIDLVRFDHSFFDEMISHLVEVTVDSPGVSSLSMLFEEEYTGYLGVLTEKCDIVIIYATLARYWTELVPFTVNVKSSIEDLFLFIEDNLGEDIVDSVSSLSSNALFGALTVANVKESTLVPLICYLLSYGLKLNELDLQFVYEKYGYCDLFKILLHMDFELEVKNYDGFMNIDVERCVLPMFIYDANFDLLTYFRNLLKYPIKSVGQLLDYFADDDVKRVCTILSFDERVKVKAKTMPQIPLLLQLARDAFRKFFKDKYKIKTSSQFYTYMNHLPINNVYKKIITFEKKIY